MKRLQYYFEIFNIKGGPLMGLWTLLMIGLTASGRTVDSGAVTAYLGALAAYGVSRGHRRWMESRIPAAPAPDMDEGAL